MKTITIDEIVISYKKEIAEIKEFIGGNIKDVYYHADTGQWVVTYEQFDLEPDFFDTKKELIEWLETSGF